MSALPHFRNRSLIGNILQITFLNRRDGWIVARWGASMPDWELARTTDGGRTWQSSNPPGSYGYVSFVTPTIGYMLGGNPETRQFDVLKTDNGGDTWHVTTTRFGGAAPFVFLDTRRGVVQERLNRGAETLLTIDGGRHWHVVGLPRQPRVPFPLIAAFGSRLVMPALINGPRLIVYVSVNGGASWVARLAPRWVRPPSPDAFGEYGAGPFSAASATTWWVSQGRRLYFTADAGRSWRIVRPHNLPATWRIEAIEFSSSRDGWAILAPPSRVLPHTRGVLVRTTDGAADWVPVQSLPR